MARKPHPSSVLKNLPDEDQAALYEYLRDGHSLKEGVDWLFINNDVRTNDSSLSDWHKWYKLKLRLEGYSTTAKEIQQALGEDATFDQSLPSKLALSYFMTKSAEEGDAKTFGAMASIIQRDWALKAQQQAHKDTMTIQEKRLALQAADLDRKNQELQLKLDAVDREKQAALDAMNKAVGDGGMTEETRDLIRDTLGMKLD